MVAQGDRLRALQVREPRQHEVAVGPRTRHQHGLQAGGAPLEVGGRVDGPEAERGRDLVVAGAPGVHALADLAQPGHELALDERVHVLVVRVRLHGHGLQGLGDRLGVRGGHDALAREHAHVGPRRADVVGQQPPVDVERRREREHGRVQPAREPAGPQRAAGRRGTALAHSAAAGAGAPPRWRAAHTRVERPKTWMKPTAASCW